MNIHRHYWPSASTLADAAPRVNVGPGPLPTFMFEAYAYAEGSYYLVIGKANVTITCRKRRKVAA